MRSKDVTFSLTRVDISSMCLFLTRFVENKSDFVLVTELINDGGVLASKMLMVLLKRGVCWKITSIIFIKNYQKSQKMAK